MIMGRIKIHLNCIPKFLGVILFIILCLYSLGQNLSFWNDENHAALMSRGILDYGRPITSFGSGNGIYQVALYYLTALSFKIFGITEWGGRLPSVFAGTLLIISSFYFSRKVFDTKRSTILGFLLVFSQIQLAWSTQLRPYIWLELFAVWNIFYLFKYLIDGRKVIDKNLSIAVIISGISILFHGIGLINLLILIFVILYKIFKYKQYVYLLSVPIFGIVGIVAIFNSFTGGFDMVVRAITQFYFFPLHYQIFLSHNYLWLIIGASVGYFTLSRRNKELAMLLAGSIIIIFVMAIFKINPRYVRYSLPAFPLMYLLFAEGVGSVIDRITKKEYLRWLITVIVFVSLSFTGKFVFWPKNYYSINADMRENPIVDYKYAFERVNELIKDKDNVLIVDSWNDRVPWYLPGQKFILVNKNTTVNYDPVYGEEIVKNQDELKPYIASHKSGVAIVEDWESLMGEDVKDYIRKNLKFEFTVQDLPGNENDHWGISVYSWGI